MVSCLIHSTLSAQSRFFADVERLGPLFFALTLQPVLERVDAACEEAPLVSYLYNMNIVGKLTLQVNG